MKVAIVVQRYGADINGGAELHARYIAEHLARHVEVEVLTTCATDYITWRNDRPEGVETVHGIPVRRFPVRREREPEEFASWSTRVFGTTHSLRDELSWLDAQFDERLDFYGAYMRGDRRFERRRTDDAVPSTAPHVVYDGAEIDRVGRWYLERLEQERARLPAAR